MVGIKRAVPGLMLLAAFVAGCGSDEESGKHVSQDDYGASWPLTISGGTLQCEDNGVVIVDDDSNTVYAINGTARGEGYTYKGEQPEDFYDTIWKDQPGEPGLRISISPLIAEGLKLCD